MPSSKVMEKQMVVIDQLKSRLGMNDLEHLAKLRLVEFYYISGVSISI